ncbi:hypothetical protein CHLRE_03g161450v5 [Chlamydomonas reinhardtii]|uniref:Uncharacterized protein n=1 Tax=Chlamydomonas reinhardtii TaxID=3055 RepID=A8IFZ7_CHLRE|nr:uncharacterized protein CHLRE_03g161450v5 [Chlamydomonas reinhardtii]PNW84861.1 hypothetical protein CHLRE_03g161450v5 [Chlamydomonas reinhardtii]|eukprot:XP_001703396.1 predicted protein [Chlamydomonas reinhardtii]
MAAAKRGACIVRQSLGLNVDVAELTMLGYNYRCGANLEPDILVTFQGRPHAFLLLDERRSGGAKPSVAERALQLHNSFKQSVFLAAPASYGHAFTSHHSSQLPALTVVTFTDADDAVAAIVRFVDQLNSGCSGLGGRLEAADIEAQRQAVAVEDLSLESTLLASAAMDGSRDTVGSA